MSPEKDKTHELDLMDKSDLDSSEEGSTDVKRGNWGGKLDFLLSLTGYAVGLGNLWRFPYLCMRNGGGAFLIPYFLFLFLCGMPLFFMELSIGQFSSLSPLSIWKFCPLFKGIGFGMVLVSGIVCIYYNVIMAWSLYYMFNSFTTGELPWATCQNWWNTENCIRRTFSAGFLDMNESTPNVTSTLVAALNASAAQVGSDDYFSTAMPGNDTNVTSKATTPAEEFWHYNVLQKTAGIEDMGKLRLELLGCLVLAWLIVFCCLFKGVQSSGKVVYVTATVPYFMLLVLLIRGLTLPGALDGIKYYLTPDFSRLAHFSVWTEACAQIFYSLGPAYGGLMTMASYNKFNNNCYRDSLLIPCVNCGTSFFAGFVVFSIIGFMAKSANLPVSEVIVSGPGLAFVVYPEALSMLPGAPVWSVIFFIMLVIIGLDTQFGMFETMTSSFVDEFPTYLKGRKTLFTATMCVLEFVIGIPIVCQGLQDQVEQGFQVNDPPTMHWMLWTHNYVLSYPIHAYLAVSNITHAYTVCGMLTYANLAKEGGVYLFQIMDWYSATFSLMTLSFLECMAVGWIYSCHGHNLLDDIKLMIGYKPCIWWTICWKVITPLILLVVLLFTIIMFSPPTYGTYVFPWWANGIGWLLALCSLIAIPITMGLQIFRAQGSLPQRLRKVMRPTADWGPALEEDRRNTRYERSSRPEAKELLQLPANV